MDRIDRVRGARLFKLDPQKLENPLKKLLQHRNNLSKLTDFDPHIQEVKNAPKKALAGDCVGLGLGELAGRPKTAHSVQRQKMGKQPL